MVSARLVERSTTSSTSSAACQNMRCGAIVIPNTATTPTRYSRRIVVAVSSEFRRIRLDTYLGIGFSNLVGLCIIIATAVTLHAKGAISIESADQAAEALRPFAGPFAFTAFAAGIIGTGLLAVPVLAGSSAFAIGEAVGRPVGLGLKPREAITFYGVIAASTIIGVDIHFSQIDPIKALYWSTVINGIFIAKEKRKNGQRGDYNEK